jgi:hypothetical protein
MLSLFSKNIYFVLTTLLLLVFQPHLASAQKVDSSLPAKIINQIQWDIQKQMSYSSKNETTSLLWTPQKIILQNEDISAQPQINPYTPNEVYYQLLFDVSMGHNMDPSDIYWRQCHVQIAVIDEAWGEPLVSCNTSTP